MKIQFHDDDVDADDQPVMMVYTVGTIFSVRKIVLLTSSHIPSIFFHDFTI